MITTTNLTKIYSDGTNELRALDNVSIQIKKGSFVAITGRSGSGKSTLLYQLGLLDRPSSGSIVISGVDVSTLSDAERTNFRLRRLGYIFQDYALVPSLTAVENIMVPLLMQGKSMKESRRQALTALTQMDLAARARHLPSQLSGGQQQRVSIARAIAHQPEVIFADEPTANLDHETSLIVLKVFLELNRRGQTIVMVTHEEEYAKLASDIITLSDGAIVSGVHN